MSEATEQRGPRPAEFKVTFTEAAPADERIPDQDGVRPAVWMLDIDGVLNAFEALDRRRFRSEIANGYVITWDGSLTDRIHRLHLDGRVEIRWLTTWAEHANTYIAPLFGWSEFVVAGQPQLGLEWWKLPYATEVVEIERRRLVWTDDDLATSSTAMHWLETQPDDQVLAICPDPATGLTHDELDRIEAWIGST